MVIKFSQRELEVMLVTEEQLLCSLFLVKYTCPFSTGSHTLYCDPEVLGFFFFFFTHAYAGAWIPQSGL